MSGCPDWRREQGSWANVSCLEEKWELSSQGIGSAGQETLGAVDSVFFWGLDHFNEAD